MAAKTAAGSVSISVGMKSQHGGGNQHGIACKLSGIASANVV
jgi:hypothetical protein